MRTRRTLRATAGILLAALVSTALTPALAFAALTRSGDRVAVEQGETLRDDLYASGNRVLILGDVEGDVYAAGREIVVEGSVSGNVVAAGQTIRVNGDVSGTVLAAGSELSVSGAVGKDVVAAGNSLSIGSRARVERDVLAGGTNVDIDGAVGRNVTVGAQSFSLSGDVEGGVRAEARRLVVTDGAAVGGDLVYRADRPSIAEGVVEGDTRRLPGRVDRERSPGEAFAFAVLAWLRSLIGLALFALILSLLFPRFLTRGADRFFGSAGAALGIGFLVLIATPIVAFIIFGLGLLAGGWWIGLMLLAVWWIAIMVGVVTAATAVGRWILDRLHAGESVVWPALLGVLLLTLVALVPFQGWLVWFVAMVIGLGAAVMAASRPAAA